MASGSKKVSVKIDKTKNRTKKLKTAEKVPKEIVRKFVNIDPNMVDINAVHLENGVIYSVFKSDCDPSVIPTDLESIIKPELLSDICFASLLSTINRVGANRVYYKVNVLSEKKLIDDKKVEYSLYLTSQECYRWLRLAKRYKLLPPYINEKAVKNGVGEFIIDIEGLTISLLYIYLSTIRNLREDPLFTKAVVYLTNKLKMNFYAAYVFASRLTINYTTHHIINVSRGYGEFKSEYDKKSNKYINIFDKYEILAKPKIDIGVAIGLQRIVNNPTKYDKRIIGKKSRYSTPFECATTINSISEIYYPVSFQELFDKNIKAAIMSTTDKEALKYINKFAKYRDKIKYMEAAK